MKTLSQQSCQGKQEFLNEAALITAVQHRNLVKLKGCCLERDHRILVYEFMENKSLNKTLFGELHLLNKSLEAILKLYYSGKLGSCAQEIALRYVALLWALQLHRKFRPLDWIGLGIVSSSCQLQIAKIAFSSFKNTVEMQKTEV